MEETEKTTPKKRGRKPGRKPGKVKAHKKRGRKPGRKAGRPAGSNQVQFKITGGVLIMSNLPKGIKSMVFANGSKLTTVDI